MNSFTDDDDDNDDKECNECPMFMCSGSRSKLGRLNILYSYSPYNW